MALIENAQSKSQADYGAYAPHADMSKHGVIWAAVEGKNDGRWPTVRDAQDGINIGNDGRKRIGYTEFKDSKNKTHDIVRGGVTLREMICPIEDIKLKDAYEAKLSTDQVRDFKEAEEIKARERGSEAVFSTQDETLDLKQPT